MMGWAADNNGRPTTGFRRGGAAVSRLLGPDWPFVAAVLLVALVAAWPVMSQPGLLNTRGGGDSPFLLQRLHQLTAALADGHFPVRWMPDANYGYGYPFYNYYAPLSIYVAAVFRFLGFSFVRAIHLAQLAGFVVAGLGMFALGRRWLGSRWGGLLAAMAYTVAPFHLVNVYVRGDSLAEFWAMAFYPLVLLAADNLLSAGGLSAGAQGRRGAGVKERYGEGTLSPAPPLPRSPALFLALFALAYAGLILSHNISALIFSPFLLLYVAIRLVTNKKGDWRLETGDRTSHQSPVSNLQSPVSSSPLLPDSRRAHASPAPLLSILGAILLAFALAAWFFVPALAEQDLAQLGPVTEGYFHYSNHFRGRDLVQWGPVFDYNPDGGVAFRLGLAQAVLAVGGVGALLCGWRRGDRRPPTTDHRPPTADRRLYLLLGGFIAVFMITPLSRPLWDHLPLLPFTQFPWRFLSVASFFLALLTGALVLPFRRPVMRAAVALLGSLVLPAAGLLGLRVDHLILTDADVTAERLAQYEWFTGNIGTTVSAEYLTPESAPRPWTSAWLNFGERDQVVALNGELLTARLLERGTTRQEWVLEAGPGRTTALFPTMNWPTWLQPSDSYNLDTEPGSGLMSMPLQEGEQTILIALRRTPVRIAAELVSLAAVVVAGGLLVAGLLGRKAERGKGGKGEGEDTMEALPPAPRLPGSLSPLLPFLLLLSAIAAAAFLWRNDPRALSPGDLTWDFAQMAYLHHDIDGVAFENGARLHAYEYSSDEAATGDTLTVTLHVQPGDGRPATLALMTPASARPIADGTAEPPAIAAASHPLDGETVIFTLPIPPDAPPGLYVPRLTLDGARPLLPSGGTRGELFLRPVKIESRGEGEKGGRGQEATSRLDVRATGLNMRDAVTLDGRFAWYTSRPLGARYQFSWRLQDAAGGTLTQLDAQPGYGYQPSTLWPAGQWTADWLALHLPDAPPAAGDYPLTMRLYDVATGETLVTRRVGVLAWDGGAWQPRLHDPSFVLPGGLTPMAATFGWADEPSIALRGYRLEQEADALRLTLYWEALDDALREYKRFVHLIDANGAIAAQVDGAPAGDSYPTDQWTVGEIVVDTMAFDLTNLPPGDYRLATGFYLANDGSRLDAAAGPNGPLPDGRAILPDTITLPIE